MLIALGLTGLASAAERKTPSGLPVPRYISLKFDEVNARAGPGDDRPLLWVYHARGLPVQVIAETDQWRRVCDPDRGVAWVHQRTTSGQRRVMRTKAEPLALTDRPKEGAKTVAWLKPKALADLDRCDDKGWCRLKVGGITAWAPADQLWGAIDKPQCG